MQVQEKEAVVNGWNPAPPSMSSQLWNYGGCRGGHQRCHHAWHGRRCRISAINSMKIRTGWNSKKQLATAQRLTDSVRPSGGIWLVSTSQLNRLSGVLRWTMSKNPDVAVFSWRICIFTFLSIYIHTCTCMPTNCLPGLITLAHCSWMTERNMRSPWSFPIFPSAHRSSTSIIHGLTTILLICPPPSIL